MLFNNAFSSNYFHILLHLCQHCRGSQLLSRNLLLKLIMVVVCVALFQQNVVPTAKTNLTDVNRLLEQVRTTPCDCSSLFCLEVLLLLLLLHSFNSLFSRTAWVSLPPAPHHSIFTGQMLFLMPSQQHRSIEGNFVYK